MKLSGIEEATHENGQKFGLILIIPQKKCKQSYGDHLKI